MSMSTQGQAQAPTVFANRISKPVFTGISSAFLAVCLISTFVRFYIRFVIQREIGWDDGWLLFGTCCLIAGMTCLYIMMDLMYEMESLSAAAQSAPIPDLATLPPQALAMMADLIDKSVRYRNYSVATLIPLWTAICTVKFSFLALFKRLLRQMPLLTRYWWFVTIFSALISVYGATVFVIACPYFGEKNIMKSLQCTSGSGMNTAMNHSIASLTLDVVSDLFILVIPSILLWQIRIRLSQKIALALTLCLTVVMIMISAGRIIGLKHDGKLDYIWETFFIVIAAEIGLVLVAVTAFRALYVSQKKERSHETITTFHWYYKSKSALFKILGSSDKSRSYDTDGMEMKKEGNGAFINGQIPRGTMTGARTFMDRHGNESVGSETLNGDSFVNLVESGKRSPV